MHRILLLIVLFMTACSTSLTDQKEAIFTDETIAPATGNKYLLKDYHVGQRPRDSICSDLNGDGYNDLATSLKKQSLVVLFNDQKGDFLKPVSYETLSHNTSLTAADMDGDGDTDLIPLTEAMVGPVFLNDGAGNFTRHDMNIRAPNFAWHIESADLNSDNLPDLVIVSLHKPVVIIVFNKGNLAFEEKVIDLSLPDEGILKRKSEDQMSKQSSTNLSPEEISGRKEMSSSNVTTEYPNRDGEREQQSAFPDQSQRDAAKREQEKAMERIEKDTVTPGERQPGIKKLRHEWRLRSLDSGFKDVSLADINGDGHKDIVLPSYIMNALFIGMNDGKGNFEFTDIQFVPEETFEIVYSLSSVAILEYPEHKLPDVAVLNEQDGQILIFKNTGGELTLGETLDTNMIVPIRIASDDMNGDSIPDIVVTFAAPLPQDTRSPVQVWLNRGDEGFYLEDVLKSGGFSAYIDTCRISHASLPAIITSNIHEETLTILTPEDTR